MSTVASEVAHDLATTDRAKTADAVLLVAVEDAIRLIKRGRPGLAEHRLLQAVTAARRILGPAA